MQRLKERTAVLFPNLYKILDTTKRRRVRGKAEIKALKAELEARNRQLVAAQRMELMGALAAGTVHNLNNLLAVIIGYSQVMSDKHRGDEQDNKNIEIIKDAAAAAAQMSKKIYSFAKLQDHPQYETVDLGSELTAIIETLKISQPKHIHFLWQPPPGPVCFPIQPAHLQQVIMNLCLNACDAMPEGGKINISLTRDTGSNEIILKIADTGPGIEKENLERIFNPLFTTKEKGKGTGLGLFVVKEIVAEYHGKIEAHSEAGKGTAFVIRFPGPSSTSRNNSHPGVGFVQVKTA